MSEIIHPESIRLKKEHETNVVGFSPEMEMRLMRLRDQISAMLNHPMPMKATGPKEPWTDLSDRYDIIIGDFGIKDLSNSVLPPSVLLEPSSISLPAPEIKLSAASVDVEELFSKWWEGGLMEKMGVSLSNSLVAFNAGYEEGRKAK